MHNNLPFKPLLITVALASLFPMGVASASTYGIHANSQDLIIEDQNTFENVDYGVAAENGHTATINSAGDLTFTVKKSRRLYQRKYNRKRHHQCWKHVDHKWQ